LSGSSTGGCHAIHPEYAEWECGLGSIAIVTNG
jgi:hypothetical protein